MSCGQVTHERDDSVERKKEILPDEVLGSDDTGGDSVAKGVQLDCLVCLKIFLSEENVEIGVLLD